MGRRRGKVTSYVNDTARPLSKPERRLSLSPLFHSLLLFLCRAKRRAASYFVFLGKVTSEKAEGPPVMRCNRVGGAWIRGRHAEPNDQFRIKTSGRRK